MGRGFDCARYKGDIITIPCGAYPSSAINDNFSIRNDILNKVDWDVSKIKSYDDLMAAIAAVHAEYPNMTIMRGVDNLFRALISVAAVLQALPLPSLPFPWGVQYGQNMLKAHCCREAVVRLRAYCTESSAAFDKSCL